MLIRAYLLLATLLAAAPAAAQEIRGDLFAGGGLPTGAWREDVSPRPRFGGGVRLRTAGTGPYLGLDRYRFPLGEGGVSDGSVTDHGVVAGVTYRSAADPVGRPAVFFGGVTLRQVRSLAYSYGIPAEAVSRWTPGVEVGTLVSLASPAGALITPAVRFRHVRPKFADVPREETRPTSYLAVEIGISTP